jgi:hypothetical protein
MIYGAWALHHQSLARKRPASVLKGLARWI